MLQNRARNLMLFFLIATKLTQYCEFLYALKRASSFHVVCILIQSVIKWSILLALRAVILTAMKLHQQCFLFHRLSFALLIPVFLTFSLANCGLMLDYLDQPNYRYELAQA